MTFHSHGVSHQSGLFYHRFLCKHFSYIYSSDVGLLCSFLLSTLFPSAANPQIIPKPAPYTFHMNAHPAHRSAFAPRYHIDASVCAVCTQQVWAASLLNHLPHCPMSHPSWDTGFSGLHYNPPGIWAMQTNRKQLLQKYCKSIRVEFKSKRKMKTINWTKMVIF